MNYEIEHGPAFAWLRVRLLAGESIQAEAGAMVRMDPDLEMTTRLNAGRRAGVLAKLWAVVVALLRKLLGGETLFVNEFRAVAGGEVVLAPSLAGSVLGKPLQLRRTLFVQAGSYLASSGDVDTRLRFGGLRTLLGGEGLTLLQCVGTGEVFLNSYGGIVPISVAGKFIVDTGHIVAFDGELDFRVKASGGVKSLLFSGEGLVCEFSGNGTVYVQSRNLRALVGWLAPLLPA